MSAPSSPLPFPSSSSASSSSSQASDLDSDSDYEDTFEPLDDEIERDTGNYSGTSNKEHNLRRNVDGILPSKSVRMIDKTAGDKKDNDDFLFFEAAKMIEGRNMKNLKVEHCKAYLRAHGLRLAGSKATLLGRIQDYVELKAIGGEAKYPRRSFAIYCKGDVCCGDVVLFRQKVYDKFSIVTRRAEGGPFGERVIAGRVAKESYGIKKQQHTFTIEVLWSSGFRPLPPMSQLRVKGRNLYRHSIFRQRWINEDDRRQAIEEKHARGNRARQTRAIAMELRHRDSRSSRKLRNCSDVNQQQRKVTTEKPYYLLRSSLNAEVGNTRNQGKRMRRNMEMLHQRQAKKMRLSDNSLGTDNISGFQNSYAGQNVLLQKSSEKSDQAQPTNIAIASIGNKLKAAAKHTKSNVASFQVICSSPLCQNYAPQNCVRKMCKSCCKRCVSFCARHG